MGKGKLPEEGRVAASYRDPVPPAMARLRGRIVRFEQPLAAETRERLRTKLNP